MKRFYCYLLFLSFHSIVFGNFPAGTLVCTGESYRPIELLSIGDTVLSYDLENKICICKEVIGIRRYRAWRLLSITCDTHTLLTTSEQRFYNADKKGWKFASSLSVGDEIWIKSGTCRISAIEERIELHDFYDLSVADHQNFFVTENNVLVHNFFPIVIGFSWAFGSGAAVFTGVSVATGVAGALVGLALRKDDRSKSFTIDLPHVEANTYFPSPQQPKKPKKDDDNGRQKKKQRPLSNKEAREQAKKMGYRETKNVPFKNHKGLSFHKKKNFITVDMDCHKGGVWKMFDRSGNRLGTWNIDLTKMIGS